MRRSRHLLLTAVATTAIVVAGGLLPVGAQGPDPVEATLADAFGVETATSLGGNEIVRLGPTPQVILRLPNATGETEVSDSLVTVPAAPLATVGATTVFAAGSLGADGSATATAEVTDVDLLPDALTGTGVITADLIRSVSTTTCVEQTLEEASAGSQFVGLSIGGQALPVDVPANTVIEIPGVARVTVKQVIPDTDAVGFTVRGLVVQTIDPLSGAVGAELVLAEAHSSVVCGGDGGPPIPDPTDIDVDKEVQGESTVEAGDEVTYEITITNVTDSACTLTQVVDLLPDGFTFVALGGGFADGTTEVDGNRLIITLDVPLEPGVALVGELTVLVAEGTEPGTFFNDARANSTCGIGRTGLTAPVTIDPVPTPTETPTETPTLPPPPESPCPDRPEVTRFDAAAPKRTGGQGIEAGRPDAGAEDSRRVFGQDRTETTVRLSEAVFPFADAAIVARNDLFPDALAASGLAAEICGPLLLTPPASLSESVRDELERLDVSTVYIVGGIDAVEPAVEQALTADGYELIRLGGSGRHETARLIALEIVDLGGPVSRATVVRADIFPDALSGANLATWGRAPILLTDTDRLNPVTSQALEEILQPGSDDLYIVGGIAAVSAAVEAELVAEGYRSDRLAGTDRYGTTIETHPEALRLGADIDRVWVASGRDFPDALAGGIAAFVDGSALLLVAPDTLDNSPASRDYIDGRSADIDTAVIVGGPAAVSQTVEEELRAILEEG